MADESNPNETQTFDVPTAVAEMPDDLVQQVEISDVGPCKKHIKVTVERPAIDKRFDEKYLEVMRESKAQLNGFRPGKAPKQIVIRRYKSAITEEVRREVLMASLEQLATANQLSPLSPPEIDPEKLVIPDEGPFVYEFDIEVRPEFDLPNYKGLKIKRLVRTFADADIQQEKKRLLEPYGQLVPKPGDDVAVELDDYIVCDIVISHDGKQLNEMKEVRTRVEKQLVLKDGVADKFGAQLVGAKVGDRREVEIVLSNRSAVAELRGKPIQATFTVHDIKVVRLPELTPALLDRFMVQNEDQLNEVISMLLERRLEYHQRQSARQQILQQVSEATQWELPRDLLIRQAKKALNRRVLEMQNSGMSEEEIIGQQQILLQDVLESTAFSLREHFVLQKIAELEKLEIEEADIDGEIGRIADREGESPRKVRARLEREDMIEALATDLLERKALQVVLDNAEFEEVTITDEQMESAIASVEAQALPGQLEEPVPGEPAPADAPQS